MYFSNQAEAVIAIASVVLSADMIGTHQEQHFLFTNVRNMPVFRNLDHATFHKMMVEVNEKMFGSGSMDSVHSRLGLAQLCEAVKAVVPKHALESTFLMACEMAEIDGLEHVEVNVLNHIGTGLGLSRDMIEECLRLASSVKA